MTDDAIDHAMQDFDAASPVEQRQAMYNVSLGLCVALELLGLASPHLTGSFEKAMLAEDIDEFIETFEPGERT